MFRGSAFLVVSMIGLGVASAEDEPAMSADCRDLTIMATLARLDKSEIASTIATEREIVCATDSSPSHRQWADGATARYSDGHWRYPRTGGTARWPDGEWVYPSGSKARYKDGEWRAPNGLRARTKDGQWYANGISTTDEALLREWCNGVSEARCIRRLRAYRRLPDELQQVALLALSVGNKAAIDDLEPPAERAKGSASTPSTTEAKPSRWTTGTYVIKESTHWEKTETTTKRSR